MSGGLLPIYDISQVIPSAAPLSHPLYRSVRYMTGILENVYECSSFTCSIYDWHFPDLDSSFNGIYMAQQLPPTFFGYPAFIFYRRNKTRQSELSTETPVFVILFIP